MTTACLLAALLAGAGEVRQIVTFKFREGRAAEALAIFRNQLLPLYRDTPSLARFRVFHEAESPEPLDLVVVSSFRGMAGMDGSQRELRELARKADTTIGEIYGRISDLSRHHHDQFVAMEERFTLTREAESRLAVFEYLRLVPDRRLGFEQLVEGALLPLEKRTPAVKSSETGRFLISDGWDVLRILGFETFEGFEAYLDAVARELWAAGLESMVAARKRIVLRADPELRVR